MQDALVAQIRSIARAAPLFSPTVPSGKPMSVRITSAGEYGWVSDTRGYRYARHHPDGAGWPAIPEDVLNIWTSLSGSNRMPQSCLVNFYDGSARMGMHQDKDEADLSEPVVSVSLGDMALLRIGHTSRGGSTESIWLESGDVVVMGGEARLAYHGIDRIRFGSSKLLSNGGRLNLTLRVVD